MEKEQPKWKRIAKGDRLPCWSFIRKMDGTVLPLTTIGGAFSGQEAYYLPVKDVIEIIKDFPKETVMDYEKEYKLLIARLKALADVQPAVTKAAIESQFPEIVESEDEKIRNWLISTLKSLNSTAVQIDGAYEMMLPAIALLEKQGEKKPVGKPTLDVEIPFGMDSELVEETMTIPKGCYAVIEDNKVVIRKGEKPAEWSEEDEKMLKDTIRFCELCGNRVSANWLKSLSHQSRWRPGETDNH